MLDNRNQDNYPIVTVSVITYNSSKYVLETLESIKAQTYPSLILQVCDDCSADNTLEICQNWIEENKDRFVKTKIVVPEHNTGVSANFNRSWDACESEYIKDIAGDDLLLPYCIEDNMNFVREHPDAVFVFSKVECFGSNPINLRKVENLFDYSFFDMSPGEQLDRLLKKGNCIPAATVFCNINKIREMGLRHDERIPLLEDLPKWVNYIRMGGVLYFNDKILVKYRTNGGISTETPSLRFSISCRLFFIYYVFPYKYETNPTDALNELAKHETDLMTMYDEINKSTSMKIGRHIVNFLWMIPHLFKDK